MGMGDDRRLRHRRALAAIRRSARVARSRGVTVVPSKEAQAHLAILFEDPRERMGVMAAYDHLEDIIVFNADHPAWADMRGWMKEQQGSILYSTAHPQHIVRHELGHAAHYRGLSRLERERIWFAEGLRPGEESIALRVSIRAAWNPKEFVAEVFAGLWGGVDYDAEVIRLFEYYRGQRP
jgi:hypothetical protein